MFPLTDRPSLLGGPVPAQAIEGEGGTIPQLGSAPKRQKANSFGQLPYGYDPSLTSSALGRVGAKRPSQTLRVAKLTTAVFWGGGFVGGRYDPPYAEEYGGGYGGYASYPSTSGTSGGDVDAKARKKEEKRRLLEELQRLREVQEKVRVWGSHRVDPARIRTRLSIRACVHHRSHGDRPRRLRTPVSAAKRPTMNKHSLEALPCAGFPASRRA
jgi:hypothetical protein